MKIVIASDFHFQFQSDPSISILEQVCRDIKPDKLILAGDLLDCHEVSKFDKVPSNHNLLEEIMICKEFLQDMRLILPKAEIIFLEGNHCFRLKKYLIENIKDPSIYNLVKNKLSLEELLDLKRFDIKLIENDPEKTNFDDVYVEENGVLIGHFNKVSTGAGNTAKFLANRNFHSIIQAHVHRLSVSNKTIIGGKIIDIVECGCMCSLKPIYCSNVDWQNGFIVMETLGEDNFISAVKVINGRAIFNGKLYVS